jgi:hypothetical protein
MAKDALGHGSESRGAADALSQGHPKSSVVPVHPAFPAGTVGYLEQKYAQAKGLVGQRVEMPVHYDAWAMGNRYGQVTSVGRGGKFVNVQLDKTPSQRTKLHRVDFDYAKVIK